MKGGGRVRWGENWGGGTRTLGGSRWWRGGLRCSLDN